MTPMAARAAVRRCFHGSGRVLVALSGGVDSAVLLALAVEALGAERVLAATGDSPSLPRTDLEDARRVAAEAGVVHEVLSTAELSRPEYRANRGDRCFHCRSELFERLQRLARQRGCDMIVYGAIKDDVGDHRPGMLAAQQQGVRAPLLEAGVDKGAVRSLAADLRLAVRDKPAAACLASRIPVGTEVTRTRLERIGHAEADLRALGFGQLRVRDHGDVARLEFDEEGLQRMADPALRREVAERVGRAGFRHVALDLRGYRSGSLNPPPKPAGAAGASRKGPARSGGQ